MATVNHKKAIKAAEVTAFGGIDASLACGDGGMAADMKNFKLLPDGSLCRRSGFAVLRSFEDRVRGVHLFRHADGDFLLAAVGTSVYRIPLPDGECESTEVLGTDEGRVLFFDYDGDVYMLDGAEVYRHLGGASFEVCCGYVPLYGKDWDSTSATNPMNEPINLVSDKVRFHYVAGTMFTTLHFGIKLSSVDKVVEGGVERPYARTLSADGTSLTFTNGFRSTKPITVYATVDPSYWHDAVLRSCGEVTGYESFGDTRVFLWGGDDATRLFVSRPVDDASLAAAREAAENATSLYFPKGGDMRMRSCQGITAVGRVGDRMMICAADRTWITEELTAVDPSCTVLPVRGLSLTVGCTGGGGFAVIGNDTPITLSAGDIYRWDIDPQLDRGCSVARISDGVAPLFNKEAFGRLRLYYVGGEDTLWVFDPEDAEGRVLLYDCTAGRWYSYVGIAAERLFETGGAVGFFGGHDVCLFDESRSTDLCAFGEREIVGVFESCRMDFGDSEAVKRAVRVYAEADLGGGELAVALYDGRLLDEVVFGAEGNGLTCYSARVTPHRCRRLSVTLRATGKAPQRIFGFCVHAAQ